jgi:hypothetical protein
MKNFAPPSCGAINTEVNVQHAENNIEIIFKSALIFENYFLGV